MPLSALSIDNFRNFQSIHTSLSPTCNLLYGDNGAGKTSFLEAIYYLSMGKSFRTRLNNRIINQLSDHFLLRANISHNCLTTSIRIQRTRSGEKNMHLGDQKITSVAPLAKLLPVQLLSNKSALSLSEGPKTRRSMLDWGVFHLMPPFLELWQRSQHIQKHRNVLLKQQQPLSELIPWNNTLSDLADQINACRLDYMEQLQPLFQTLVSQLLNTHKPLSLRYFRGWKADQPLATLLYNEHQRDLRLGYSQSGPHRADLKFMIDNTPADDFLSQGQLKLAAYAFQLAQGQLHKERLDQSPIVLIDDLPAELDQTRRQQVLTLLATLQAQTFITCNIKEDINSIAQSSDTALFHMKQGLLIPENALTPLA